MRIPSSAIVASSILLATLATPLGTSASGRTDDRARRTAPRPIVIVWLENHTASQITRENAPHLTGMKAHGRSFANYHGVASPSLPNYLAFASGGTKGKGGTDSIQAGEIPGRTIWRQLASAGISWGVYQESMPRTCYRGVSATGANAGPYVLRHNPATPFADIAHSTACQRVEPLTSMPRRLPQVSFVTPSICNDMHGVSDASLGSSCRSGSTALIRRGDRWIGRHARAWRMRGALVLITFDEGSGSLYTVEVGDGIHHSVIARRETHYSLLAGLERRYGLALLGRARSARPLRLAP